MNSLSMERKSDLHSLRSAATTSAYSPLPLAHVYVRLDFEKRFEAARTAEDARGFLRSVARAATAAAHLAEELGGALMEVQGSVLHVALPTPIGDTTTLRFASDLHWVLRALFDRPDARVRGWRMTADAGATLVVRGRGVHGDDSFVSLGRAANRPAKHLYAQLELPEDKRRLKRFWIGVRDAQSGAWRYTSLEDTAPRVDKARVVAEKAQAAEPAIDYSRPISTPMAKASAAPIGPAWSPSSPSADRPQSYFGWVMRADLDGFSARVEGCFDNDLRLQELALEFRAIMDAAAEFVERHRETLVQLPWAGDNFTAAALFSTVGQYDAAAPDRLVELSLDFEKDMRSAAGVAELRGWAHGVAGGVPHGNSHGNVFIGAVLIGGRRFLVGAGEGFGRSAQAFGDVNPDASQLVLYHEDTGRLAPHFREAFERAVTHRGEGSTLYDIADMKALLRIRARKDASSASIIVSAAGGRPKPMVARPYFK